MSKIKLSKKHILPITLISAGLVITANANAAPSGPYFGGQIGWGDVHQGGNNTFDVLNSWRRGAEFDSSSSDTGLAGRVYGGYKLMQNFAIEAGFTKFHNATEESKIFSPLYSLSENVTIKTYAIDLVGKGIIPFDNGFNVYGKLGVAYLNSTFEGSGTELVDFHLPITFHLNDEASKFYPTFGLGAGYELTQNLSADVSWNRIQKVGDDEKIPSTDFVGVGLAYNFG